jgi:hypothetical protein
MTMVRRDLALLLSLLLSLSAACGDKTQPFEGDSGLPEPVEVTTTAPGAQPSAPPGESPATTTAPHNQPDTPPATGSRTPAPAPGEDPIAAAAKGSVGAFARTLLRPEPAERLVIDVLVESGAAPSAATLDSAVAMLEKVSGKPVSVTMTSVEGGKQTWTGAELRALADSKAPTAQGGSTAVIRALFVKGGLEDNDSAVGVAVRGDVLAVFSERVSDASSPLVSRSRMEEAILTHEIGHLLGLVDLALDTGRDDPDHPGHSRNSGSVMYWAVESTLVGQALNGPPPTKFDDQDLADLAKLRSGA